MKSPAITLPARIIPPYQTAQVSESIINKPSDNHRRYKPTLTSELQPAVQFDAATAHGLRGPLTTINLSIEMLKHGIQDPDLLTYLDIILRSSTHINTLIDDLLKHHQPVKTETQKHSIHLLLDEVLEMAKDRTILKGILVRKDFIGQDCLLVFDRPNMKIALTNIIMNAIDAINPDNTEKGELKLVTKSIEGKYLVQIEDNGCGISEQDIQHIFKPYFTNKSGGLGLGLSTTNNILLANHVKAIVESETGKGTRFILSFNTSKKQSTRPHKF